MTTTSTAKNETITLRKTLTTRKVLREVIDNIDNQIEKKESIKNNYDNNAEKKLNTTTTLTTASRKTTSSIRRYGFNIAIYNIEMDKENNNHLRTILLYAHCIQFAPGLE